MKNAGLKLRLISQTQNLRTPQTLLEAVRRGSTPEEIEAHVKDFLRQVLGAALLEYPDENGIDSVIQRLNLR